MSRPAIFASQVYEEALAAANLTGKLLVLDATASWCQPCKTMDQITWVDAKVIAWFAEHAIALQVDVDEQKELARSLGIRSMPTIIAFRSGKEIDRLVGMRPPGELLAWLEALQRGETAVDQLRKASEANPHDVQARLALAKAHASSRNFAAATEEFVRLWQHMLEHQPSMLGVRSSFMLNDIEMLMREYAPARVRFTELRDALGVDGVPPTASPQEVADWISLSQALGDQERILDWHNRHAAVLEGRPDLETTLRVRLVRLLTERGRWADVARFYRDPLATLRQANDRLAHIQKDALPAGMEAMRPRMIEGVEDVMRKEAGVMVAALVSAGRESEARAVLEEIRRLSPGEKTEQVLVKTAREASIELP